MGVGGGGVSGRGGRRWGRGCGGVGILGCVCWEGRRREVGLTRRGEGGWQVEWGVGCGLWGEDGGRVSVWGEE